MSQTHGHAAAYLQQSGTLVLRERWTEEDVLALPTEEQDRFDRKSGRLLNPIDNFRDKMAAALSAMANSGGGHIIFGQEDDGAFSPLPEIRSGKETMKDWLEKTLPWLVSYPLERFRVHTVERAKADSKIPEGQAVIVIDVADSRLAPHQAAFPKHAPAYYFRQGGRSVLAPHHYLEALRNRITAAVLVPEYVAWDIQRADRLTWGFRVYIRFLFNVSNEGKVASFQNSVVVVPPPDDRGRWEPSTPSRKGFDPEADLEATILPTRSAKKAATLEVTMEDRYIGFQLQELLRRGVFTAYAISENHVGEPVQFQLNDSDRNALEHEINRVLASASISKG